MALLPEVTNQACRAAANFLLRAQDPNGSWLDFCLPAGVSDMWVTGYAGTVLASIPAPDAQGAANSAWRFLEQAARSEGGWSYNSTVPGDGDSTLWGLRLATALGVEDSGGAKAAAQFLGTHFRPDGGIATYASAAPICAYIGLPPVVPFAGWTQSHVCVSAAGANLPGAEANLRSFLLAQQRPDGSWPAYWWFDDEYATAEAVAALAQHTECAPAVARAVNWALARAAAMDSSGAFARALWLRILARGDSGEARAAVERGVAALIEQQNPDGSCQSSARLRVPRPDVRDPSSSTGWRPWAGMPPGPPSIQRILEHTFTIYSLDQNAIFTTATALAALLDVARNSGAEPATAILGEPRYV